MPAEGVFKKVRKYAFQCDLVYATLALTRPFWNPAYVAGFFRKWRPNLNLWRTLDKHLHHGLSLLFFTLDEHHLAKECIPNDVLPFYQTLKQELEMRNLFLAQETASLVQDLQAVGLRPLVLKGVAYHMMTDDVFFQSRLSSDIDLLILGETFQKAKQVANHHGYEPSVGIDPVYSSESSLHQQYYEQTLVKKAGQIRAELGLHWSLPTGQLSYENGSARYEVLSPGQLNTLWQNRKEIQWHGVPVPTLSETDLFRHFLMNVNRDSTGQINIIRWLHGARDLFELKRIFPNANPLAYLQEERVCLEQMTRELETLTHYLFQSKENSAQTFARIPQLLYDSLIPWVPHHKHARQVLYSLRLSRIPFLFRLVCFWYLLWQNR